MMDFLRQWLTQLIGAALLMAAVSALTPQGAVRRIALLCGSVIFLLALLRPLTGELPRLTSLPELTQSLQEQKESYERENLQQWETLIEQELSSYIESKAAELGLHCGVSVRVEPDGDEFVLREVTLTAAEESAVLTGYLATELGVAEEQIRWRIT